MLGLLIAASAVAGYAQTVPTVNLPKPDADGWIKIFRGDNLGDFSIFTGTGSPASEGNKAFGDPFFVVKGDTIRTDGSPGGQLIFKQNFSHYIMEVQLRWPGNVFNCGVMTKIQWNANGIGSGLPQCVEVQGDPNQGMGQVWTLGTPPTYITFKGKKDPTGNRYIVDDTQPVTDHGGSYGCIVGYPGWQKPYPATVTSHGWVTITAENHGKDTAKHFVDGQKVMQYWNPRAGTGTSAKSLVEGMVSIQSEGGEVWYRNWRIKLLPEDPLYASLYNPVTLAPKPANGSRAASLRLGFDGKTLSVLSDGRPVATLTGRLLDAPLPSQR